MDLSNTIAPLEELEFSLRMGSSVRNSGMKYQT